MRPEFDDRRLAPSTHGDAHAAVAVAGDGPARPTLVGSVQHGYTVVERVGAGGFGEVYRAASPGGTEVALKFAMAPDGRERLTREHRATSGWQHPHVVQALDLMTGGERDFLVLEFVRGRDCRQWLRDHGGPLSLAEALRVVHAIGQGLEALHARGWVHRDVTPGNLLVDERDGVVKLADFGLARPIEDVPDEYDLTRAHETIGTPGYMSPEQWATPKSVQPPSDLFMLAGCLYFLLTGDPPFDRYGSPTRDFPADVDGPDELRALLARAGHRDPASRYPTAAVMLAEIDACRRGLPASASSRPRPTRVRSMTTEQLPRTVRFSPAELSSTGLAFDATIGAFRSGNEYVVVQERGDDAGFALDQCPELSMREMAGATVRLDGDLGTLVSSYYQTLVVEVDGKALQSRVCRPRTPLQWPAATSPSVFFSTRSGDPEWVCSIEPVGSLTLPAMRLVGLSGVRLTFRSTDGPAVLCTICVVRAAAPQGTAR